MTTPNVTIGGIPIQQQGFSWSFTAGPEPYQTSFVVPNHFSNKLKALENPVEIKIKCKGSVGRSTTEETEYTIKNCWLLEPSPSDKAHNIWSIADNRFSYRGRIVSCCYNKTRQKNSFTAGVKPQIGTPAELRLDFDVFGAGRYIPWSIKNNERPYTMQEILVLELEKLGIPMLAMPTDPQSYYIENVECNGVDVYSALRYLCQMARYEISIDKDGKVYAYNVDYYDKGLFDQLYARQETRTMGSGRFYKQEKFRVRPKEVTVYYEKKQEVWVTNSSSNDLAEGNYLPVSAKGNVWTDVDIANQKVIGCENVIRIPYPTTIAGKEYKVGEWLPMWRYLSAVDLTETEIRSYWFSNALETVYVEKQHAKAGTRDKNNEVLWRQIIAAVRQHYRQTFQIDPLYMDAIENWDTRRVGIVDNYSHFSPPSPLYSDFTVIPKARQPAVAKRVAGWADQAYVWDVNTNDPGRTKPTPGTVSIVSQPLGIFAISYPSVMYSALYDIIPFGLNSVPEQGVAQSVLAAQSFLMRASTIKTAFEMQTIISVVRAIDPVLEEFSTRKYYPVIFENTGGKGPGMHYLAKNEYARFAVKEMSDSANPTVIKDNTLPVNLDIINHLARTEASRLLHNYDDFPSGNVALAGIIEMNLQANLASITLSFTPNDGFKTVFAFKPVPGFSLDQRMSQDVINFVHKHVSRGGDKNLSAGSGL